jgi:hypothetical protein
VHSVYNAEDEKLERSTVLQQLQILNAAFSASASGIAGVNEEFRNLVANVKIQFYLAQETEGGASTDGLVYWPSAVQVQQPSTIYSAEHGSEPWNPERYLNIWVANLGGTTYGWAKAAGSSAQNGEGVVVDYRWFSKNSPESLGKTLVHELGHYFGLSHTWGAGGCESDDGIDDTPVQAEAVNCGAEAVSCGSPDMVQNFMNIADDVCLLFFTTGQAQRMRAELLQKRPQLASLQQPLGLADAEFEQSISWLVSNNRLYITIENPHLTNASVSLYSVEGRVIAAERNLRPDMEKGIPLPAGLQGVCILVVSTSEKVYRRKILLDNRI